MGHKPVLSEMCLAASIFDLSHAQMRLMEGLSRLDLFEARTAADLDSLRRDFVVVLAELGSRCTSSKQAAETILGCNLSCEQSSGDQTRCLSETKEMEILEAEGFKTNFDLDSIVPGASKISRVNGQLAATEASPVELSLAPQTSASCLSNAGSFPRNESHRNRRLSLPYPLEKFEESTAGKRLQVSTAAQLGLGLVRSVSTEGNFLGARKVFSPHTNSLAAACENDSDMEVIATAARDNDSDMAEVSAAAPTIDKGQLIGSRRRVLEVLPSQTDSLTTAGEYPGTNSHNRKGHFLAVYADKFSSAVAEAQVLDSDISEGRVATTVASCEQGCVLQGKFHQEAGGSYEISRLGFKRPVSVLSRKSFPPKSSAVASHSIQGTEDAVANMDWSVRRAGAAKGRTVLSPAAELARLASAYCRRGLVSSTVQCNNPDTGGTEFPTLLEGISVPTALPSSAMGSFNDPAAYQ